MLTHAIALHKEEIEVPLIIRYPKEIPEDFTINNRVQILDIAPTIYDFLNYETSKKVHGKSLLPFIKGAEYPEYPEFSFSLQYDYRALQNDQWKFVYDKNSNDLELFNLKEDPRELENAAAEYPDKKNFFLNLYSIYKKKYEDTYHGGKKENREELLRSLGYIK